jgi:hypothetical protein
MHLSYATVTYGNVVVSYVSVIFEYREDMDGDHGKPI